MLFFFPTRGPVNQGSTVLIKHPSIHFVQPKSRSGVKKVDKVDVATSDGDLVGKGMDSFY